MVSEELFVCQWNTERWNDSLFVVFWLLLTVLFIFIFYHLFICKMHVYVKNVNFLQIKTPLLLLLLLLLLPLQQWLVATGLHGSDGMHDRVGRRTRAGSRCCGDIWPFARRHCKGAFLSAGANLPSAITLRSHTDGLGMALNVRRWLHMCTVNK